MGSPIVMDGNPSTFDLSSGLAAYQAARKYKDEQVASQAAAQYKAQQDAIANKQTSDQQAEVVRYHDAEIGHQAAQLVETERRDQNNAVHQARVDALASIKEQHVEVKDAHAYLLAQRKVNDAFKLGVAKIAASRCG